jgi:predicted XRE-type DNA-binding protein
MSKTLFADVWDAVEDTPAQAENKKLRSTLIMALKDRIARTGLSQSEAARLLGRYPAAHLRSDARQDRIVWPRYFGQ